MKERPIIFSAPMVRAILSGAKTQTRRVVPTMVTGGRVEYPGKRDSRGYSRVNWLDTAEGMAQAAQECKYGRPGNRLWVRETWGALPHMMGGVQPETLRYRADCEYQNERGTWRWRSSIHMPRWASRISLRIGNGHAAECGTHHDRDVNAALNLQRLATATALPVASPSGNGGAAAEVVSVVVGKVTPVRYEHSHQDGSGQEENGAHVRALS